MQRDINLKFDPENNVIDQLLLERVLGMEKPEDSGAFFKRILDGNNASSA
jgi:hypothetical protein